MKQDHYMTHLSSLANTVLWRSQAIMWQDQFDAPILSTTGYDEIQIS